MTDPTTLCASGDCPLRDFCDRSPNVEIALGTDQPVTVFAWGVDDDGSPDCDAFIPRPEWEQVE